MLSRIGLATIGLLFVAMAAAHIFFAVNQSGVVELVIRFAQALFFGLIGLTMLVVGLRSDADTARWMLRDFLKDLISRRNLTEAVAFLAVIILAVLILLMVRGHGRVR